jgi:YjbE family integral membrane protein
MVLTDLEFWGRLLGIALVDLMLAGDNALIIAMAVRALPERQKIRGQIWGSLGGVALRLLFIASVSFFLTIPLLQAAAGLLLLWIAMRLVRHNATSHGPVRHGSTLIDSIRIIILADVVMSLDNILAVAALAKGNFALVAFGISLSLPLVVWGSGMLARLMDRQPWVIWSGGGILGYASGEMMLKDAIVRGWLGQQAGNVLEHTLPFALALITTGLGWWLSRSDSRGNSRRRDGAESANWPAEEIVPERPPS